MFHSPAFFKTELTSATYAIYSIVGTGSVDSGRGPVSTLPPPIDETRYSYIQHLYTSQELVLAGLTSGQYIEKLAFNVATFSPTGLTNSFDIYCANTTQNQFVDFKGLTFSLYTQVATNSNISWQPAQWNVLEFDTPFEWNGQNICFAFNETAQNFNSFNLRFTAFDAANVRVAHFESDSIINPADQFTFSMTERVVDIQIYASI